MEEKYVKDTYNCISDNFSHTRYKIWHDTEIFLDELPSNSTVLEVGCGNGKNMMYREDLNFTGIDNSEKLVEICKNKNLNVSLNCMTKLPFENKSFDYTLCIASLHHLETFERRRIALNEMIRVTKKKILITLWNSVSKSIQPTKNKPIDLENNNYLIPWKYRGLTYYRFYHLTTIEELDKLFNGLNYTYYEVYGNFVIEIKCDYSRSK